MQSLVTGHAPINSSGAVWYILRRRQHCGQKKEKIVVYIPVFPGVKNVLGSIRYQTFRNFIYFWRVFCVSSSVANEVFQRVSFWFPLIYRTVWLSQPKKTRPKRSKDRKNVGWKDVNRAVLYQVIFCCINVRQVCIAALRRPRWLGRLSSCLLKSILRVQFSPGAHTGRDFFLHKIWLAEGARAWISNIRLKSTSSGKAEPYAR